MAFVERIATAQTRSWWHVSQFIIAEAGGEAAASLCALPAAGTGLAARAAIEEIAGPTEALAIISRGAYARNCWVQGDEDDWLIEHVATLPEYRGRGLVQALIEHALATGKAAGFERASISFLIGNDAAERSYAKAGFTFAEEKRDPAFEALTGERVVDMVVTDLAVFTIDKHGKDGMALIELADGVTLDEVKAKTEAEFRVALKNA